MPNMERHSTVSVSMPCSMSFFATVKTEIGIDSWPDRATARRDIGNWITKYNRRRLHSALGHQTPTETRRTWQERIARAA